MKKSLSILSLSALLLLGACGSNEEGSSSDSKSGDSDKQLVVVSWGGDYQAAQDKAMFQPFIKDTGANLVVDGPVNIGKVKTMVDSGNIQWDVVDALGQDIPKLIAEDLLEPIDYSIVEKTDLLDGAASEYDVDIDYYSTVLSYNKDNLPGDKVPESWADFFDTKNFPGSRSLYKSPITTLEIALLADGVPMDQLYPLDVDRAFKMLDKIKKDIVWWEQGAQPAQLLSDKEVVLAAAWNARIAGAINSGQSLDYTYNQGILDAESWVVVKGTKNKETAMEFINYASKAQPQADLLTEMPYGPTNTKAFELMDEEYAKSLPTHEDNVDKQMFLDVEYWNDNFNEINDRFQAWLLQ